MDWNHTGISRSISDWKEFQLTDGATPPSVFSKGAYMRYHYEKPGIYSTIYGSTYSCNHPVYNKCTLFKVNSRGLAVIQQRYDPDNKTTYWDVIDPWLVDELYLHAKFEEFFSERAGECENGLYPTVTIRQFMWGLKMKPLPRERWETCFDRRSI